MTEERKQELRHLLQEAMESIVITRNSMATMLVLQEKSMSIEEYRECLQTRRRSYRPDLIVTDLAYRPEIQDDVIKSKLLNFIRAELKNYIREHKHKFVRVFGYAETIQTAVYGIHGGGTPMGFPIESLLEKFLKIIIASGAETAISAFDKCTKETKVFFQKIIFIRGIGINGIESHLEKIEQTEEVKVSQGIRLITLPTYPSELPPYLFEDVFSTMLYGAAPMIFYGKTLMVIDCEVAPLFCKPHVDPNESSYPFQVSIRDREFPNFDVTKFCQALSLSCNFAVEAALEWKYINENEMFDLRTGSYSGGADRVPLHVPSSGGRVSDIQISEAKRLYKILVDLDSGTAEKLQIAIGRWIKSKISQIPEDKIIDLAIAFETLYVPAKVPGKRRKIVYNLKKNASRYLGTNKDDQEKLEKKFKVIYDCRCDAAHEGKLKEKIEIEKDKHVPQSEFITEAQDLCRQSIMKILDDREFLDWNNLILGEESL